jgi:hypothetical protein
MPSPFLVGDTIECTHAFLDRFNLWTVLEWYVRRALIHMHLVPVARCILTSLTARPITIPRDCPIRSRQDFWADSRRSVFRQTGSGSQTITGPKLGLPIVGSTPACAQQDIAYPKLPCRARESWQRVPRPFGAYIPVENVPSIPPEAKTDLH